MIMLRESECWKINGVTVAENIGGGCGGQKLSRRAEADICEVIKAMYCGNHFSLYAHEFLAAVGFTFY